MLDAETLNPGKQSYPFSLVRFHVLESESNHLLFLRCIFHCTDWNIAKDVNKLAVVNGVMECAPADGTIPAHIQVMMTQSFNIFLLIFQILSLYWLKDFCSGYTLHSFLWRIKGKKKNYWSVVTELIWTTLLSESPIISLKSTKSSFNLQNLIMYLMFYHSSVRCCVGNMLRFKFYWWHDSKAYFHEILPGFVSQVSPVTLSWQ